MGWWQTEANLDSVNARFDGIEAQLDPAEIRGSFSFSEISEFFGIPLESMAEAFMLPDTVDPQNFYNRDLEGLFGVLLEGDQEIGNSSVQLFVALYAGLPYEITEDIYLPQAAVQVLKAEAVLTAEQEAYLEKHAISIDAEKLAGAVGSDPVEEHDEEDAIIKGNTTFYDMIQWGVPESAIMALFEGNMPPTAMLVKDYCIQNGYDFAAVKNALQPLVDAAQTN